MLKGHLPRVIYHEGYSYTKKKSSKRFKSLPLQVVRASATAALDAISYSRVPRGLLLGPAGALFLMSEVPLYRCVSYERGIPVQVVRASATAALDAISPPDARAPRFGAGAQVHFNPMH